MSSQGIINLLANASTSVGTDHRPIAQRASSVETGFTSSLALRIAALQAQTTSLPMGLAESGRDQTSGLDALLASLSGANALSANMDRMQSLTNGRNLTLFDPESAYRMMSVINTDDVTYKAQFAELSAMKTAVASMQSAGQKLGTVSRSLDDATITTQLQAFVDQYNAWIDRFGGTVRAGGVLAGTQAAEVSLYELKQSIENPFNGAADGFRGLEGLGLTIDQASGLASLDVNKLKSALASNRTGAINTVTAFSANFAKSAELLISSGNFILNRLDNLERAIGFIQDNRGALQAEFGTGAPASVSDQVTRALASYRQIAGI